MGWFERPEFGANVGLIDEIYRQYLDNPESVSPAWRDFFAENERREDGDDAAPEATDRIPRIPRPRVDLKRDAGAVGDEGGDVVEHGS